MPVRLTVAPASEPVTLAEAKAHLRLETATDDVYIGSLITAARMYAEEHCWRGFISQTWELVRDTFDGDDTLELGERGRRYGVPNSFVERPWGNYASSGQRKHIALPRGNLITVTWVKYIDPNGVQQTLPTTEYSVDNVNVPGRIRLEYGKVWPQTRMQWDGVRVLYLVGFADAAAVPMPIKQAILLLISQMYEHRTPEITGILSPVKFAFESLLRAYRLNEVG